MHIDWEIDKVTVVFIGIALVLATVIINHLWSLWHYLKKGRKALTLEELYQRFSFSKPFDKHKFDKIVRIIGKSYGVNFRYLRPEDEFRGNLEKISLLLPDAGMEELMGDLEREMKIKVDIKRGIRTIQDLMNYCEEHT